MRGGPDLITDGKRAGLFAPEPRCRAFADSAGREQRDCPAKRHRLVRGGPRATASGEIECIQSLRYSAVASERIREVSEELGVLGSVGNRCLKPPQRLSPSSLSRKRFRQHDTRAALSRRLPDRLATLGFRFFMPAKEIERDGQAHAGRCEGRIHGDAAAEGLFRLLIALEPVERNAQIVVRVGGSRRKLDRAPV